MRGRPRAGCGSARGRPERAAEEVRPEAGAARSPAPRPPPAGTGQGSRRREDSGAGAHQPPGRKRVSQFPQPRPRKFS